jgi:hypothetical protein
VRNTRMESANAMDQDLGVTVLLSKRWFISLKPESG